MSFLACHMWSFGWALASGAAWGLFRAMAFQSPPCHLLDQRPCSPSPADVAAAGTAETCDCPTAGCLPQLHAYGFRDCYRSLITYVEADTQLINALLCGQYCWMLFVHREEVCVLIFFFPLMDVSHLTLFCVRQYWSMTSADVFWRTAGVAELSPAVLPTLKPLNLAWLASNEWSLLSSHNPESLPPAFINSH